MRMLIKRGDAAHLLHVRTMIVVKSLMPLRLASRDIIAQVL